MSLLWCDGFDHYGVTANLTEGAWAENTAQLSSVNPRTGAFHLRSAAATTTRRVLGGAKTTVGIGSVVYMNNLPLSNNSFAVYQFRDAANVDQISVIIQSTGTIEVKRGPAGGTSLGVTASPVVVAEAYQHIEALVFFSQTVGTVEVRVNGVTVFNVSGVDTVATSLVECSQVAICRTQGSCTADMDDVFCYDGLGSFNNTFLGDRRVLTLFPDANTVQADWTVVGAATGYEAIDEASPDGDTSYITAGVPGSPGDISEFGIQNLPAGVSSVSGVVVVSMARKTEAGPANTQWSVISGSFEAAGANTPMTEVYTYRQDVFESDPGTGAPFTPTAVNDLEIKVERTQ